MIQSQSTKSYYDNFVKRLLKDYLYFNPRTTESLKSGMNLISFNGKDVLDIGCGIGWSSYEFAKYAQSVLGIDLSDNSIKVANELFKKDNIRFESLDVTKTKIGSGSSFDIITMIDVFEHIPFSNREAFAISLNRILKPSGLVYLSCPSIYHQDFLRKKRPEELQPIEEDIDVKVLWEFALALDKGDVVYFSYKTIWDLNDYFHAIIQKGPVKFQLANNKLRLENSCSRVKRVKHLNNSQSIFSQEELKKIYKKIRVLRFEKFKQKVKEIIKIVANK